MQSRWRTGLPLAIKVQILLTSEVEKGHKEKFWISGCGSGGTGPALCSQAGQAASKGWETQTGTAQPATLLRTEWKVRATTRADGCCRWVTLGKDSSKGSKAPYCALQGDVKMVLCETLKSFLRLTKLLLPVSVTWTPASSAVRQKEKVRVNGKWAKNSDTLFSVQIMSKDVLHALMGVEGIDDVKASSYSVCPFLSIKDDKATGLKPSLMRVTRKIWLLGKKNALLINPLLLRDCCGVPYSNSCRDAVFGW